MRSASLAALAILFLASPASAGETSKPRLLVSGTFAFPSDPELFKEGSNPGFGGGFGIVLPLARLTLLGHIDYTIFNLDEEGYRDVAKLPDTAVIAGGELRLLYMSGSLRMDVLPFPTDLIRPYVIGGAGFFRKDPHAVVVDGVEVPVSAESAIAFHGGGGLRLSLGSVADVFGEALYVYALTKDGDTAYVPLRVGLTVDIGPGS